MTRHDIYQTAPATGLGQQWRDATPLGNGYTGVLLYGGAAGEQVVLSRSDLWHGSVESPVPDVSGALAEMRALQREGKGAEACNRMFEALNKAGYHNALATPRVLGCVRFQLDCNGVYRHYRRILHMNTGEAEIRYDVDGAAFERRCFVSRKRDVTVLRLKSETAAGFSLAPDFYRSFEGGAELALMENDRRYASHRREGECLVYSSRNEKKYFGIVLKVISNGTVSLTDTAATVADATDSLVLIKAFSMAATRAGGENRALRAVNACEEEYTALFAEHRRLHGRLYHAADVKLYHGRTFRSNEALLADAREEACSAELAEKLWRFGRYLFISGVDKKGLPFPLYGLWHGGYERPWAQHVANENVQIIHWHTGVGGLSELMPSLIRYFCGKIEEFRENARQLFGCSGIFVSTYTSPYNGRINPHVPVILHFLGTAGWLCRQFYEYYRFTGDQTLYEEQILPFMLETAAFYEDYLYTDKQGKIELYPAVSPENSPEEYHTGDYGTVSGHPMPVTKNPTVEVAILRELLTNLVTVCANRPDLADRVARWRDILSRLPDYTVNEDGAVAEWLDPTVHDHYEHRHLSHVYPLFPGSELEESGDLSLLPAFRRAVDLRKLGHMTGWSMAHMAAIYARLQEGEKLFGCLNMVAKVCLLPNFFTLHNDYRMMGITGTDFGDETFAPVQLDALMGCVNAVQEMLLFAAPGRVKLLPACPKCFPKGTATLQFVGGTVTLSWDADAKHCKAVFLAKRDVSLTVSLPFDGGERSLTLKKGASAVLEM